jgi:hypothetical protein
MVPRPPANAARSTAAPLSGMVAFDVVGRVSATPDGLGPAGSAHLDGAQRSNAEECRASDAWPSFSELTLWVSLKPQRNLADVVSRLVIGGFIDPHGAGLWERALMYRETPDSSWRCHRLTLPLRAGCGEMPLPGDPIPGPDRCRQGTMDDAVETSAQRVRYHLRRPISGSRDPLMEAAGNTVSEIVPGSKTCRYWPGACFGLRISPPASVVCRRLVCPAASAAVGNMQCRRQEDDADVYSPGASGHRETPDVADALKGFQNRLLDA